MPHHQARQKRRPMMNGHVHGQPTSDSIPASFVASPVTMMDFHGHHPPHTGMLGPSRSSGAMQVSPHHYAVGASVPGSAGWIPSRTPSDGASTNSKFDNNHATLDEDKNDDTIDEHDAATYKTRTHVQSPWQSRAMASSPTNLGHPNVGRSFDSPRQIAASVLMLAAAGHGSSHHTPEKSARPDGNLSNSSSFKDSDSGAGNALGEDGSGESSIPLKKRKMVADIMRRMPEDGSLATASAEPCHVSPMSHGSKGTAPASGPIEQETPSPHRGGTHENDDEEEDDDHHHDTTPSSLHTSRDSTSFYDWKDAQALPDSAKISDAKQIGATSGKGSVPPCSHVLVPPSQVVIKQEASHQTKKTGDKPHFPSTLHYVLSESEFAGSVVQWLPHGHSWKIVRWDALRRQVLPKFFAQFLSSEESAGTGGAMSVDAFLWHLSAWGFEEVTHGPDAGAYAHVLFRQGLPELCLEMRSRFSKEVYVVDDVDAPVRKKKKMSQSSRSILQVPSLASTTTSTTETGAAEAVQPRSTSKTGSTAADGSSSPRTSGGNLQRKRTVALPHSSHSAFPGRPVFVNVGGFQTGPIEGSRNSPNPHNATVASRTAASPGVHHSNNVAAFQQGGVPIFVHYRADEMGQAESSWGRYPTTKHGSSPWRMQPGGGLPSEGSMGRTSAHGPPGGLLHRTGSSSSRTLYSPVRIRSGRGACRLAANRSASTSPTSRGNSPSTFQAAPLQHSTPKTLSTAAAVSIPAPKLTPSASPSKPSFPVSNRGKGRRRTSSQSPTTTSVTQQQLKRYSPSEVQNKSAQTETRNENGTTTVAVLGTTMMTADVMVEEKKTDDMNMAYPETSSVVGTVVTANTAKQTLLNR